jgi:hypothetical protein
LGIPTDGTFGIVFDAIDQVARHPVQLYEAAAYFLISALLLGLFLWSDVRSRRGFLTGIFMINVFAARLLLEPFKLPQASFEAGYWLSVGQVLSIPFVLFGFALVVRSWSKNKKSPPYTQSIQI